MIKLSKKQLLKISFEFLSTFLGLVLALALNNWNEQRKQEVQALELLNRVFYEVNENIPELSQLNGIFSATYLQVDKNIKALEDAIQSQSEAVLGFEMEFSKVCLVTFVPNSSHDLLAVLPFEA